MAEIQSFCRNCHHRRIPTTIKQKFNQNVKVMFLECPMRDKQVAGCLIKDINVDWKSFSRWLEDNRMLDESEKKNLELLKLYDGEKTESEDV